MARKHLPPMPAIAFTRPLHSGPTLLAEQASWRMHLAMRGRDFATMADLQRFLDTQHGALQGPLPKGATAADRAQDLFYRAHEASSPSGFRRLLRDALREDPDNVDARVALAHLEPDRTTPITALREALALGRPALTRELEDDPGDEGLWPRLAARPALRALAALALELIEIGQLEEAVEACGELLALDPGDHQGARYVYFGLLLELGRFEEARRARQAHADEDAALFAWGEVLLEHETGSDAAAALARAREHNEEVEALLLHPEWAERPPEDAEPGTTDEAEIVADLLWRAWHKHPSAIDWLRSHAADRTLRKAPKAPVWERILKADDERLRSGLLPLLDPADEATIARLWELAGKGPKKREPHVAEGAIELLDRLGVAGQRVEALVGYLRRCARFSWVADSAVVGALAHLGEAAVASLLKAHAEADDEHTRIAFAEVLAHVGVRDKAIFDVLLEALEVDTILGAIILADYGDPAGLPYLSERLDAEEPAGQGSCSAEAMELIGAIQSLGGTFTTAQQKHFALAIAKATRWATPEGEAELEEEFFKLLEREEARADGRGAPEPHLRPFTADDAATRRLAEPLLQPPRPARNDPCWCGSGTKYKRCHLQQDEAGAS